MARKMYIRTSSHGKRSWDPIGTIYSNTIGVVHANSDILEIKIRHPYSGNRYTFTIRGQNFELSKDVVDSMSLLMASGKLEDEWEMDR